MTLSAGESLQADGTIVISHTVVDFFDEKRLEARDLYVEEFVTDVLTTPPDKLVIHIFMPVK